MPSPMTPKKFIRNASMVVIFTILILGFAFFGLDPTALTGVQGNIVAAAGSRTVDRVDYKQAFENIKRQVQQNQGGRPVTNEELAAQGGVEFVLNQIKGDIATLVILDKVGVRPSLDMMGAEIRKIPQFFDEVSGRFDVNNYRRVLADNDLTEAKFKRQIASQISSQHMASAMGAGINPPATMAAYEALMVKQTRDISVLYVTPSMVGAIPAPTDQQLTAYMNENADAVRSPESRALTVVRFSLKDMLPSVTVTEQEIQQLVDFRKEQQSVPEMRTLVQVSVKDKAAAQTVSQRLSRGEDAATVARAAGGSIVNYDNKPKTAIPDAKVADAAFSLGLGQSSGPIEGSLGFSVVRVVSISAAQTPDLAKLRSEAAEEAKKRAAQAKIREQADKLEKAVSDGGDLAEAARAVGAKVTVTEPIYGNGETKDGRQQPGVTPAVTNEAGQLSAGEQSDIKEETPGEYFIVRVDRIVPPAMPPLAEVRGRVAAMWHDKQLADRIEAKVNELAGKARQAGSLEAAAREAGGNVTRITGISYAEARTLAERINPRVLDRALRAKKDEVFSDSAPPAKPGDQPVFFIGRVDAIHQADPSTAAAEAQRLLPQVKRALSEELAQQANSSMIRLVPVKTYPDRARSALGLAPLPKAEPEKAKAPAGGAAKK